MYSLLDWVTNTLKKQMSGKQIHERMYSTEDAASLCKPGEKCTAILGGNAGLQDPNDITDRIRAEFEALMERSNSHS